MKCLFCQIANKEKEADIVYEDDQVIAFKDINPKAPTHIVVASKKHISSLNQMKNEHKQLLGEMILAAKKIAKQKNVPGYKLVFNVGEEGGQFINHFHFHLLIGKPKQWP